MRLTALKSAATVKANSHLKSMKVMKTRKTIASILAVCGVVLLLSSYQSCVRARETANRMNTTLHHQQEAGEWILYGFIFGTLCSCTAIVLHHWETVVEETALMFSRKARIKKGKIKYDEAVWFAERNMSIAVVLNDLAEAIELDCENRSRAIEDERFTAYRDTVEFKDLTRFPNENNATRAEW